MSSGRYNSYVMITKLFSHSFQVTVAERGKRIIPQIHVTLKWSLMSNKMSYCFLYICFWSKVHMKLFANIGQ